MSTLNDIQMGKVLYDFDANDEGEISLTKGEFITILDKSDEGGWWRGEKLSGEVGDFPFNYIAILSAGTYPDEEQEQPQPQPQAFKEQDHPTKNNITTTTTTAPLSPLTPSSTTETESTSLSQNKKSFQHQRTHSKPVLAHVSSISNGGHSFALSFREAGIQTIEIISTEVRKCPKENLNQKKYTIYNVRVKMSDGNERTAGKRYSEFRALQIAIKTTFPVVGQRLQHKLQSKMQDRLQHFRRFNDDIIEKRKITLELYLYDLASMPSVSALLMAWLFQEKAEVEVACRTTVLGGVGVLNNKKKGAHSTNPQAQNNEPRIGRAIAIADWTGTDETDMDLWQGETYTLYKYLSNAYVEVTDSSGMRGMAPNKYFRMMIVPGSGNSSSSSAMNTNNTTGKRISQSMRQEFQEETKKQKDNAKNVGGVEKFQLESCEAFDQLMNEGYAVEKKNQIDESDVSLTKPTKGDIVVVELVGMLWDASQTFVTQFVTGCDLNEEEQSEKTSSSDSSDSSDSLECQLILGQGTMTRGLDLSIMQMKIGEQAMCVLTPALAFGDVGEPKWGVPASVHVVFDVKLISIKSTVLETTETKKTTETTPSSETTPSMSTTTSTTTAAAATATLVEKDAAVLHNIDLVDRSSSLLRIPSKRRNRLENNETKEDGGNVHRQHYSFAGQKGRKGRVVISVKEEEEEEVVGITNDNDLDRLTDELNGFTPDTPNKPRSRSTWPTIPVGTGDFSNLSTEELMAKASEMMGLSGKSEVNSSGEYTTERTARTTRTTRTTPTTPISPTTPTTDTERNQPNNKTEQLKKESPPIPKNRTKQKSPSHSVPLLTSSNAKVKTKPPPAPIRRNIPPSSATSSATSLATSSATSTALRIPYDELIKYTDEQMNAKNIDKKKKENNLSDEDFQKELGVTREEFVLLPGWKKNKLKMTAKLF